MRTVARKIADWIGRLGEVWVEGQVAQLSRRGGAATEAPAPSDPGGSPVGEEAGAPDVATDVDVLTPDGGVATVEGTVTDEGVAAPEAPAATATDESGSDVAAATGVRTDVGGPDTSAEDAAVAEGAAVDAVGETSTAPTDDPQGGSELSGSQAVGAAPVDGYDSFSIAHLRGRLRGYALKTVQDLLAYEEATRAREPYLRLLHNQLEKLQEQAVESSPLAPRGV